MNPWFYFVFYGMGWFALGGVVVGSIVHTVLKAEIRDLKDLLRGCGVVRQYPKRWFWSRAWGIRAGQWLPRSHRKRGSFPRAARFHSSIQPFPKESNYDRSK